MDIYGRPLAAMATTGASGQQMVQDPTAIACCGEAEPVTHDRNSRAWIDYYNNPDAYIYGGSVSCDMQAKCYTDLSIHTTPGCAPHPTEVRVPLGDYEAKPLECRGHIGEVGLEVPCTAGSLSTNCTNDPYTHTTCLWWWWGSLTLDGILYTRRLFGVADFMLLWFPRYTTIPPEEFLSRYACCPASEAAFRESHAVGPGGQWQQRMYDLDPLDLGIDVGTLQIVVMIDVEMDNPGHVADVRPLMAANPLKYSVSCSINGPTPSGLIRGTAVWTPHIPPPYWYDTLAISGHIDGSRTYHFTRAGTSSFSQLTPLQTRWGWANGWCIIPPDQGWSCSSCWNGAMQLSPCCNQWVYDPGPPPVIHACRCAWCETDQPGSDCWDLRQSGYEMEFGVQG